MEFEKELTKPKAVELLGKIGKALESDTIESLQIDDVNISLSPGVEIVVEYETDDDEAELEIELKWSISEKKKRRAKFEVFKGGQDEWYFRLKAPNGEVILASEGYASKQGVMNGVESIKKHAGLEYIEKRTSKAEQPYFVLKAANNQIIGTSQMYKRQSSCDKGAQSVISNAPDAETVIVED